MDNGEVTISKNSPQYEYCREGNILLYKKNNITTAMYISSEEEDSDSRKNTVTLKLKAYGHYDWRYLLDKVNDASVGGYDIQTGNGETVMKHFVNRCCVFPAQVCRAIPNLSIASDSMFGETITYKGRFQLLQDAITEIARASGLGWYSYYDSGVIYFDVLVGENKTSLVKFDETQGNIYVKNYFYEAGPTTAIITDSVDGTGKNIIQYEIVENPAPFTMPSGHPVNVTKLIEAGTRSGLDRKELLIESSDSTVEADMVQKGLEVLEEKKSIPSIECTLIDKRPYEYMKDFFVGDMVHIKTSKYEGDQRVIRVEEEIMSNGKMQYQMFIGKIREDLKTDIAYNNKIMMNEVRK
jgi:hypothetical protein